VEQGVTILPPSGTVGDHGALLTTFRHRTVCPVLVGRDAALAGLSQALDGAIDAHGGMVLIGGEAGIGKSRLAAETLQQAVTRGFAVLATAAVPEERDEPYAPLVDALRNAISPLPPAVRHDIAGPYARELSRIVPDIIDAAAAATSAIDDHGASRRLHTGILRCLTAAGGERPLVLLVEDLHWCDAGSLDAFVFIARRATSMPLLLLATYRNNELEASLEARLTRLCAKAWLETFRSARCRTAMSWAWCRRSCQLPAPRQRVWRR